MQKKYDYEKLEKEGKTDAHLGGERKEEKLADVDFDGGYSFRYKNIFSKTIAFLFWVVVAVCTPFIVLIGHGVRIKGKRNLRGLKNTGVIAIPNHVLYLDCMIAAQCIYPKKVYFHVLESSMKLPVVRHLMKALGAMPIPAKVSAKRNFIAETDKILQEKKCICVYPEASMWPYYEKIRPFKTGAFHFAVKNNVPVVPICINFRRRRGSYKKLKIRAKFVTVHIGKPIYANASLEFADAVSDLSARAKHNMERMNHWFKVIDKNLVNEYEMLANRPIFMRDKQNKSKKNINKKSGNKTKKPKNHLTKSKVLKASQILTKINAESVENEVQKNNEKIS